MWRIAMLCLFGVFYRNNVDVLCVYYADSFFVVFRANIMARMSFSNSLNRKYLSLQRSTFSHDR